MFGLLKGFKRSPEERARVPSCGQRGEQRLCGPLKVLLSGAYFKETESLRFNQTCIRMLGMMAHFEQQSLCVRFSEKDFGIQYLCLFKIWAFICGGIQEIHCSQTSCSFEFD